MRFKIQSSLILIGFALPTKLVFAELGSDIQNGIQDQTFTPGTETMGINMVGMAAQGLGKAVKSEVGSQGSEVDANNSQVNAGGASAIGATDMTSKGKSSKGAAGAAAKAAQGIMNAAKQGMAKAGALMGQGAAAAAADLALCDVKYPPPCSVPPPPPPAGNGPEGPVSGCTLQVTPNKTKNAACKMEVAKKSKDLTQMLQQMMQAFQQAGQKGEEQKKDAEGAQEAAQSVDDHGAGKQYAASGSGSNLGYSANPELPTAAPKAKGLIGPNSLGTLALANTDTSGFESKDAFSDSSGARGLAGGSSDSGVNGFSDSGLPSGSFVKVTGEDKDDPAHKSAAYVASSGASGGSYTASNSKPFSFDPNKFKLDLGDAKAGAAKGKKVLGASGSEIEGVEKFSNLVAHDSMTNKQLTLFQQMRLAYSESLANAPTPKSRFFTMGRPEAIKKQITGGVRAVASEDEETPAVAASAAAPAVRPVAAEVPAKP